MDTGGSAAGLAEEGEICRTGHVHRRERCAAEADPEEERVAVGSDVVDDLVLRPEAGERNHTGEGKRRHTPCTEGDGHELAQAAHVLLHVKGVMRAGMTDRSSSEEQTALEEGVCEHVEDSRQPGPGTEAEHHVAQLGHGRIRQHLLDVVLDKGKERGDDNRDATDDRNKAQPAIGDVEALPEHGVDPGNEEHAGDNHGGRVQQR